MSTSAALTRISQAPVSALLNASGRLLYLLAIPLAMNTPRMTLGGVNVTPSDVVGGLAGACWLIAFVFGGSGRAFLRGAAWPALAVVAGVVGMPWASDLSRAYLGFIELCLVWVMPALAVPSLFDSPQRTERLLRASTIGALLAAGVNIASALAIGFRAGIPQIWGPADYLQGYFQVIGLAIAVPRGIRALKDRRTGAAMWWAVAIALHAVALLLAQTRGAWIAALAVLVVMSLLAGRRAVVAAGLVAATVVLIFQEGAWASILRERVQSIFTLEAGLVGFDSSVIRLALAFSALRMFADHPVTGVGLKNFLTVLPDYGFQGLPEAVEMGLNGVVTPIEGPHSTYLSLLAEAGILGFVAVVGWVTTACWRLVRRYRRVSLAERPQMAALVGGVIAIGTYNCFAQMNQTGALPFVALLAIAYRLPMGREEEKSRV